MRNELKEIDKIFLSLMEETNLQARQVELTEMKLLNEECILFFSLLDVARNTVNIVNKHV